MKTINRSTALALSLGLSLGLASLSASAQQTSPESEALVCDADGDGFVGVDEATACAEQEFDGMAADEDYLTEEQFGLDVSRHRRARRNVRRDRRRR